MSVSPRPIGLFDSGVGGLTVLRALRQRLPGEPLVYLGDTARVPYGTKSAETIARYAVQAVGVLVERGIKLLVVACNTASAHALPALAVAYPDLPVVGVIEPGAAAACAASRTGRIAVIATDGTIRAGAYDRAIRALRPDAQTVGQACSLLVSLAEEGWTDGPIVEAVVQRYLDPLFGEGEHPDCLVLGCTHFPLLAGAIASVVGPDVALVDSASTTANRVADLIAEGVVPTAAGGALDVSLLATDAPERFAKVAANFLPWPITPGMIELVDVSQPVPRAAAPKTKRALAGARA